MTREFETNMYYAFGAYVRGRVTLDGLYRGVRVTPELIHRYKEIKSYDEAMRLRHRPYIYGDYTD